MKLYHSKSFPLEGVEADLRSRRVETMAIDSLQEIPAGSGIRVVLIDAELARDQVSLPAAEPGILYLGLGLNGGMPLAFDPQIYLHLPANPYPELLRSSIQRAAQHATDRLEKEWLIDRMNRVTRELDEIHKIGIALSTVRDHDVLLPMILSKSREISRSDAGSLYLLDEDPGHGRVLRWKLAQNDSIAVDFEEKILPITKESLAGYVALTGETLVIDDAYELPDDVPYSINTSFDREFGYRTRSMLVFPMSNHVGDIIGVLQLINRKREGAPARLTAADVPLHVISFDQHTIRSMQSLAGAAAVAVENNYLYESIERLFEGFVTASVTAIEQRDPTTSGHSFRVADLTVELAKIVDACDHLPFREIRFTPEQVREIRYASLLHDFGKVGVREKVLVKEKKLYPLQIDLIRGRFEFLIRSLELAAQKKKTEYLLGRGGEGYERFAAEVDREMAEAVRQVEQDLAFIMHSNEPTVLPEGEFKYLQQLSARQFVDLQGNARPLVEAEEVRRLSIRKGNLDTDERSEIESHVTHTYEFLSKIPWTTDLRSVPDIAYAHHEKLNGRGYPRGLDSPRIPVQSKMMTVSDIYDALTASDRPYKRAVPTERALDILGMEVNEGLLDADVVRIFVDAKIYQKAGIVRL
ncbi:MAG TPA: HD domain-containing phosphohydrolase [Thermoanaerobaculia bacterium]|nr:HD domain-containing phosphohydrolase [Thermoanaerobaculia bacterium]